MRNHNYNNKNNHNKNNIEHNYQKTKQRAKVVTQTSDISGREAPSSHPAPLHFVREPLKHKLTTIDLCILP